MNREKLLEISEKIKNNTATEEEVTIFAKEMTALLASIRQDITK